MVACLHLHSLLILKKESVLFAHELFYDVFLRGTLTTLTLTLACLLLNILVTDINRL